MNLDDDKKTGRNNQDINDSSNNNSIYAKKRKIGKLKINSIYEGIDNKNNNIYSNQENTDGNKDNKDDIKDIPLERQNFTWFKYIWFMICCGTNDKKISYYENVRTSLISEENIIQSYLDIYQLLKVNNIEKKSIFNKKY